MKWQPYHCASIIIFLLSGLLLLEGMWGMQSQSKHVMIDKIGSSNVWLEMFTMTILMEEP
jgi:hypothetical protein